MTRAWALSWVHCSVLVTQGALDMLTKKLIFALMFVLMLAAGGVQAGGDAAKGAELAAADCADCHGDDSLGDEDVPAIGGIDEAAMLKELMAFKSGERVDEMEDMVETVEEFNEQDLADLAAYFSTLPGPEEGA